LTTTATEGVNDPEPEISSESLRTANPFDHQSLLDELSGNTALLSKLLKTFGRESTSDLAGLETALDANDAARVARLAHRIKGSAAVMGAWRVREQAAMIEACAQRCDLTNALPYLRMLRMELKRCSDFGASLNICG